MAVLRVNIILADPSTQTVLIERLNNYARRAGDLKPVFTGDPVPERRTDCYALPYNRVGELTTPGSRPPTRRPIIAYGPPGRLRRAFIDGCNDYLKEPWTPEELYFRVLRNCRGRNYQFAWGSLEIDGTLLRLHFADVPEKEPAHLNGHQAKLLETLLTLRGTVVSRDLLFFAMWDREGSGSRAVDMQIHGLREALGRINPTLAGDSFIHSVYGSGYIIE